IGFLVGWFQEDMASGQGRGGGVWTDMLNFFFRAVPANSRPALQVFNQIRRKVAFNRALPRRWSRTLTAGTHGSRQHSALQGDDEPYELAHRAPAGAGTERRQRRYAELQGAGSQAAELQGDARRLDQSSAARRDAAESSARGRCRHVLPRGGRPQRRDVAVG